MPQLSRAVRVVLNAWRLAIGGCIFADAPNAVTSAAVIPPQISTRRNTTWLQATQSSPVSNQASSGFTIIAQENFSMVQIFPLLIRIH
jgi:hypothetical protein